jgi:hypothetical protein
MVLVLLALAASCTLGLFSLPFLQIVPPPPPVLPSSGPPETELLFPDQEARDAFRAKVDRMQRELDRLVNRQAELEKRLAAKTLESKDLTNQARRLREELRFKEREMNALNQLTQPRSPVGRRFVLGTTEYSLRASEAIKGFIAAEELEVRPATMPLEVPAEVVIALTPTDAQPGDSYRLEVQIHNRGNRSVHLTGLELTWSYAGKNSGGSIPFRARIVGPRSSELLHQIEGIWFEDLHNATIVAIVILKEGGRLKNRLSW